MRAEQQLQAVGEQSPDIGPGAAAVTSVQGGKRPGQDLGRRLALLLPVSASGPESASAQDDHLRRSPGSAILTPPRDRPRRPKADSYRAIAVVCWPASGLWAALEQGASTAARSAR